MKQELIMTIPKLVEQHEETPVTLRTHKLWQVVNDCITKGRYTQMVGNYSQNGTNRRCMMGVFMGYTDMSSHVHGPNGIASADSRFGTTHGVSNIITKEMTIGALKDLYYRYGKIEHDVVVRLNDTHKMTFEEFRDLFKEMDV